MFRFPCFHSPSHHHSSKKLLQRSHQRITEIQVAGNVPNAAYFDLKTFDPSFWGDCCRSEELNRCSCPKMSKDSDQMRPLKKSQSLGSFLDEINGFACHDVTCDNKMDQEPLFDVIEGKNVTSFTKSCSEPAELNEDGVSRICYSDNCQNNNMAESFAFIDKQIQCKLPYDEHRNDHFFVQNTVSHEYSFTNLHSSTSTTVAIINPTDGSFIDKMLPPRSRSCENLLSPRGKQIELVVENGALDSVTFCTNMIQEPNSDERSSPGNSGVCYKDKDKDGNSSENINESEQKPFVSSLCYNSDSLRNECRDTNLNNVEMDRKFKDLSSSNDQCGHSPQEFYMKRVEEWVSKIDIQNISYTEDPSESSSINVQVPKEEYHMVNQSVSMKHESRNPTMELAYKYLSSLAPTSKSAQLSNLGLVLIPVVNPFGSLRAINLSGNAIVQITGGALPRNLHSLNLSRNNISTIEGLRELTRLRMLDISCNRLSRIGHGLASCSYLKELYLAGNKISEVEGLHRLLKLSVLDLSFNKIATSKGLGQLAANTSLQIMNLEGNPAQRNVGDSALRKHLLGFLPNLVYFNRQKVQTNSLKEVYDHSSRSLAFPSDRGANAHKHPHKATGSDAHKGSNFTKHLRNWHEQLPPSTKTHSHVAKTSSLSLETSSSTLRRIRSEGAF